MGRYIIRRLLSLIPILLIISFFVYFMMSLTGDPVATMMGEEATVEQMEIMREKLGLNDPFIVRYGRYIGGVLRGDFGTDLAGKDVLEMYMARIPYTIMLAFAGLAVAVIIAIPCGVIAAVKQNTWIDTTISTISVAGLSIPSYWLGLMLMIVFSIKLGWLPTSGCDSAKSIIMPGICAGLMWSALIARTTRSAMLDCIRADYLRTARAKGVSEKLVVMRHAFKNALIPILTTIGSTFSNLIGGVVVVETVFSWPGIGNLIISSVRSNEYTLVTGCVILTTIFVALTLLVIDVLYAYFDPRIKASYVRK